MAEKHAAWKYIIATMPDCEIAERPNTAYRVSLHEYLKELMDFENRMLGVLHEEDYNSVYSYSIFYDNDVWCESDDTVYSSYDACLKNAVGKCMRITTENTATNAIISIKKLWLNNSKSIMRVHCDAKGNVKSFTDYSNLSDSEFDLVFSGFDGMWFAFPTPFERGDILETNDGDIFVLNEIISETIFRKRPESSGDTSDMTAFSYFEDLGTGELYYDCIHSYMHLKKYDGGFYGKLQILQFISRFLKSEIDLLEYTNSIRKLPG